MGIAISNPPEQRKLLQFFLTTWSLERVEEMTLEEYTNVGKTDTFTYMLEFGSENLGVISGRPSNKFGIWHRGRDTEIIGRDFLYDETYAWYKKYGQTPHDAFGTVRSHVVSIIENAQSGNISAIDDIDLDSLSKWKIAFLYSSFKVFPAFKIEIIRKIAEILEHSNYRKAKVSELHYYILEQKDPTEDFFDFAARYFNLATQQLERSYYIIGSKYEDENGNDTVDIFPDIIEKGAISTGFFWSHDFTHLVGKPIDVIYKWIDKNIPTSEPKFSTARRTLAYFINLKPGDIVAIKSHGSYGNLTIIAYAVVKEKDGKVYEFGDPDLGHLIYVDFLETDLYIETGLTYAQTIHKITPGEKVGHFEKIFGSYAFTIDDSSHQEEEKEVDSLRQKNVEEYTRSAVSEKTVRRIHNAIQNEFSIHLKNKYPGDHVRVEEKYVDVWRKSKGIIYLYEIKPYNSAYACIRTAMGQLFDYAFSNLQPEQCHLISVGVVEPTSKDLNFLNFIRENLNIRFHYEYFDRVSGKSYLH